VEFNCYQFTWVGPEENNLNDTTSCEALLTGGLTNDVTFDYVPCFEPLVYTRGENRLNGPNLTQIEQGCKTSQTIDGTTCDPLCNMQDKTCVKLTYYNRDADKSIA